VVFDHVSVTGASDGAIDVTREANNVTIQWSILGPGSFKELDLLSLGAFRVTAHHNLYAEGIARMPGCDAPENGIAPSAGPVCDARNNLIWNYHQAGTEVRFSGATANVVNNYYKAGTGAQSDQIIWLTNGGVAYTNGNFQNDFTTVDVNAFGNRSTPFTVAPAEIPVFTDARTAALDVRANAGARGSNFGLDSTDQGFINSITIP
jgi:pectate lyase